MESQFQIMVDKALQLGLTDMVKELFLLKENNYMDEDLNFYIERLDIEILERMVRDYCKWRFYIDPRLDTFYINVKDTTEEIDKFIKWFIKFFYYLEAMELAQMNPNHSNYHSNDEIEEVFDSLYTSYPIDISEKRFVFNNLFVNYI